MSLSEYLVHYNYTRPFKVELDKQEGYTNAKVYLASKDTEQTSEHVTYLDNPTEFQVQKVFVGKSPKIAMTETNGFFGPELDGNTLLFCISKNKYIHIATGIKPFISLAEIVFYVSPVGNNDIPMPYAIDKSGNYYLFLVHAVILAQSGLKTIIDEKFEKNPYAYFYDETVQFKSTPLLPWEENSV